MVCPLLLGWRRAPDSRARDRVARDTDVDTVLESPEVANQRLERGTIELSAAQL